MNTYLYRGVLIRNDAELDAAINAWFSMTDAERQSAHAGEILRAVVALVAA